MTAIEATGTELDHLTSDEVNQLEAAEATIAAGLAGFVEVGEALASVRDSRLYRQSHDTFEDYCRDRWGLSRAYVHRIAEASEITRVLPMGNTPSSTASRITRR